MMAHEISLEQAAEKAHQAEIICRMMEVYPNKLIVPKLRHYLRCSVLLLVMYAPGLSKSRK